MTPSDRHATIAISSASRGTGVTSVALHLAGAIGSRRRTCVVDLDATWGGAAARLGLAEGSRSAWTEPGATEPLALSAIPVAGGFRILTAPTEAPTRSPQDLILAAQEEFSCVILDAPAGEPIGSDAFPSCRTLVVIVPPTREGMCRASALDVRVDSIAFVMNRTGRGGELTQPELAAVLGHPITLELPHTPALRDAEDDHRLLHAGRTRWSRRVSLLARSLCG